MPRDVRLLIAATTVVTAVAILGMLYYRAHAADVRRRTPALGR